LAVAALAGVAAVLLIRRVYQEPDCRIKKPADSALRFGQKEPLAQVEMALEWA